MRAACGPPSSGRSTVALLGTRAISDRRTGLDYPAAPSPFPPQAALRPASEGGCYSTDPIGDQLTGWPTSRAIV